MTDPLCTAFVFNHMWWDLHTEDRPTESACRTWRPTISDKDHHIADSLIGLCIWINGWVLSFDFCFKPNNCLLICACYRLWCHRAITYVLLWSPCDLVSTKMLTLKKSKEEKKNRILDWSSFQTSLSRAYFLYTDTNGGSWDTDKDQTGEDACVDNSGLDRILHTFENR